MIEFREIELGAMAPDPSNGGVFHKVPLVQRTDPLTRKTTRILTGVKLQPETPPDLTDILSVKGFCPFCTGTIENVTYPFEPGIVEHGRLSKNRAWIVPNIMAYSTYSSVGVYDISRHFLDLMDFTPELLFDAFSLMVEHAKFVRSARPDLQWSSISANYLPSSGSSVLHPHLQSSHDSEPVQYQRDMVDGVNRYSSTYSSSFFDDLIKAELGGPRYVGKTGSITWLTPFAPRGFQEVWGVFDSGADIVELSDSRIMDLANGLSTVLKYYKDGNFSAFNYSLVGSGSGSQSSNFRLVFRILVRSNPDKFYRSDVTYFERMLDEPLIDVPPEMVAEGLRGYFN